MRVRGSGQALAIAVSALLGVPSIVMLVSYGTVSPCAAFKQEARAVILSGERPGDLTRGSQVELAGRGLGLAIGASVIDALIDAEVARMSTLDCTRALIRLKTGTPEPRAAPAPAAQSEVRDPTGFRDFPWGTPEATLRQHFDVWLMECYPNSGDPLGTHGCRVGFEMGDVKPTDAAFYLRGGKLVGWRAQLPRYSRDTITAALKERYGPPTLESHDTVAWHGRTAMASLFFYESGDVLLVAPVAEVDQARYDREATQRRATEKTSKGF